MPTHAFQDLLKSIQRKWSDFMEDEGHASFPFNDPPQNTEEPSEVLSEDREKFEEFISYENKEYKKIGCNEIPLIIQRLKTGVFAYCDITGKTVGFKRLHRISSSQTCLNDSQQMANGGKK